MRCLGVSGAGGAEVGESSGGWGGVVLLPARGDVRIDAFRLQAIHITLR